MPLISMKYTTILEAVVALDQHTLNFLQAAAEAAGPNPTPMWELSPQEARELSAANDGIAGPGPDMHETKNLELTGWDGGTFEVRVHRPIENPHSVLVYLHGGGWVLSSVDSFDTVGRMLADQSGATVVMVNYRKAPENPFPAAVEDAWTGLQWAADNIANLATDSAPLYVAGDSAGGNLAAVMALRAKNHGAPNLARQILIYPVTDADFSRPSYSAEENQTLLTKEFMEWFWDHYVPNPEDRSHPEAAPLRADDLTGVAPALISTAAHDVRRDEGVAYSNKLKGSGVDVEYHDWPGQMHSFFGFANVLPASNEVVELIANTIRDREKVGSK